MLAGRFHKSSYLPLEEYPKPLSYKTIHTHTELFYKLVFSACNAPDAKLGAQIIQVCNGNVSDSALSIIGVQKLSPAKFLHKPDAIVE